jgi:hypothetical protein
MALDWGTVGSIAFGGAITVLTSVAGVSFKEWIDRRREARVDDVEFRAAARRTWGKIALATSYFAISDFYGRWATTGASSIPTELSERDSALLSRDAELWNSVQHALMVFVLALDARSASPDQAIPENSRPLVRSAIALAGKAARRLADVDDPIVTDDDIVGDAILRELFGDDFPESDEDKGPTTEKAPSDTA